MTGGEAFVSLRDVLRVLFRRRRAIVSFVVLVTVVCAVVVYVKPPTFEAASKLVVRRMLPDVEELSISPDARLPSPTFRQVSQADVINTEIAIIKSRDLVLQVMEEMDLTREQFDRVRGFRRHVRSAYQGVRGVLRTAVNETKYFLHLARRPTAEEAAERAREVLVTDVTNALVVEQIPNSDVLRVGFRCSDPALAQSFSRLLCDHAIEWHIDKFRPQGNESFYEEQAEAARVAVEVIEKELAAARSSLDLIGADERQTLLVQYQLNAKARLNEIRARQAAIEAGMAELSRQLESEPSVILLSRETEANPVRHDASAKVTALDLKRAESATKFSPDGRILGDIDEALREARAVVDGIEARLEGKRVEGLNTLHQTLRQSLSNMTSERAALTAEAAVIREQIGAFDHELKTLNERTYRVQELERQRTSRTTIYERCLRNAEIARVGEDRQRTRLANLGVIESAGLPLSPVAPRKWLYTLLAAGGSLLLGVCWAFAVELNDDTISTEAELKDQLDCPVLGTLRRCA